MLWFAGYLKGGKLVNGFAVQGQVRVMVDTGGGVGTRVAQDLGG